MNSPIGPALVSSQSTLLSLRPFESPVAQVPPVSTITRFHFLVDGLNVVYDSNEIIFDSNEALDHQPPSALFIFSVAVMSAIFMLWSMPWPLQRQVPLDAFIISASSAGGFISGIAVSVLGGALASAAFGSALGCAAARPVIPTNAMAILENVFMCMLLGETGALYSNARSGHHLRACSV